MSKRGIMDCMAHPTEPRPGQCELDAWRAAIDFGIDVSGVDERLSLTPAERLRRHDQALALVRAMREAGIRHYGFDPRLAEETL